MSKEKNKDTELKTVEPSGDEDTQKTTVTEASEPAPPENIYQVLMARMTPEKLATLGVQLIQVNGEQLYWVTSVGQLYAFNNKQAALQAEYAWLMSKPD